jgi:superoxide dismutase, Cu-Zn family
MLSFALLSYSYALCLCSMSIVGFVQAADKEVKGIAVLNPTSASALNQNVTGTVVFTQSQNSVILDIVLSGLKPGSQHGIHLHSFGDLSDTAKGLATGTHFVDAMHAGVHGCPNVNKTMEIHAGEYVRF